MNFKFIMDDSSNLGSEANPLSTPPQSSEEGPAPVNTLTADSTSELNSPIGWNGGRRLRRICRLQPDEGRGPSYGVNPSPDCGLSARPTFGLTQSLDEALAPFNTFTNPSPTGFNSSIGFNGYHSSQLDDSHASAIGSNSSFVGGRSAQRYFDRTMYNDQLVSLTSLSAGYAATVNHLSRNLPLASRNRHSIRRFLSGAATSSESSITYYDLPHGGPCISSHMHDSFALNEKIKSLYQPLPLEVEDGAITPSGVMGSPPGIHETSCDSFQQALNSTSGNSLHDQGSSLKSDLHGHSSGSHETSATASQFLAGSSSGKSSPTGTQHLSHGSGSYNLANLKSEEPFVSNVETLPNKSALVGFNPIFATSDSGSYAGDSSSNAQALTHKSRVLKEPTTTLYSFEKLPTELRLKIWKYACREPRNIDVTFKLKPTGFDRRPSLSCSYQYLSRNPSPGLLLACLESRTLGLEYYTLQLGTTHITSDAGATVTINTKTGIYVNWDVDIVSPRPPLLRGDECPLYHEVLYENLGMNAPKIDTLGLNARGVSNRWHRLNIFPNLKEIVLFWAPEHGPVSYNHNGAVGTELGTGRKMVHLLRSALSYGETRSAVEVLKKARATVEQEMDYYEESIDLSVVPTHKVRSCKCEGEEGCTHWVVKWKRPVISFRAFL